MNNPLVGGAPQMGGAMQNIQNIMQQYQKFRQMFTGDPRQQIQQMLNSGRLSQDQLNNAVQTANQLQRLMGGK